VTDGHPDGNKSAWLDDAFDTILSNPWLNIRAISPWHENWQNEDETWTRIRLDSSPQVQKTFRKRIGNGRFVSEARW